MNSRFHIIAVIVCTLILVTCGCKKQIEAEPQSGDSQQQQPQPVNIELMENPDMTLIKTSMVVTNDWIYNGKPEITFRINNKNAGNVKLEAKAVIVTDMNQPVTTIADSVIVEAQTTKEFTITATENLEPGLYRAICSINDKRVRFFNFGIDPFDIVSAPDQQADFDAFWQEAKDQLAAIDMQPNLIELPNRSSASRKVYLVELNSIPDGLTGDPVKIRGYYCEPQDGQRHPVIMHFYGYDTQNTTARVECPNGNNSTHAEFFLSHRGQYINNRPESSREPDGLGDLLNTYGDWFAYNLGNKDAYYYREAYMDVVQAVRFMATRETSDMTKLCAEGSSQGGALTYACAALSDYPCVAIAANVSFMCDFSDAMKMQAGLAYWEMKDNQGSMSDEQVLTAMSYFDIKNLTPRITCPVLASTGLQDDVCPSRTNIVAFNNLATPADKKEMVFGPEMGHSYPSNWWNKMNELFSTYIY